MENMNMILSLSNYSIYSNNNYYLCIPNEYCNFYHVFMAFSNKDLINLSNDELIREIRKIGDSINAVYKNGIYVLPIIPIKQLNEATLENDDRLYNKILNEIIQPTTFNVYQMFTAKNIRVSQIIKMIKQNDMDSKLVGWLSIKLGSSYIKEITFEEENKPQVVYKPMIENITHNASSIFIDYNVSDNINKEPENEEIKDSLKPAYSFGFGSLTFIIMVLGIFLVLGSVIVYMIMK